MNRSLLMLNDVIKTRSRNSRLASDGSSLDGGLEDSFWDFMFVCARKAKLLGSAHDVCLHFQE